MSAESHSGVGLEVGLSIAPNELGEFLFKRLPQTLRQSQAVFSHPKSDKKFMPHLIVSIPHTRRQAGPLMFERICRVIVRGGWGLSDTDPLTSQPGTED